MIHLKIFEDEKKAQVTVERQSYRTPRFRGAGAICEDGPRSNIFPFCDCRSLSYVLFSMFLLTCLLNSHAYEALRLHLRHFAARKLDRAKELTLKHVKELP